MEPRSPEAGAGDRGYGMGVSAADYDGDGDTDLYVTNWGANALYRNDEAYFSNVTHSAGVGDPRWGTSAAFLDYDNDGDLDLFVANYVTFSPGKQRILRARQRAHLLRTGRVSRPR